MKIDFENLGGIDKGTIELNDFTVFCGKNNSGKTYVMYSIYGLLNHRFNVSFDFVKPIVETLKKEGTYCLVLTEMIAKHKAEIIKHVEERFKNYLPSLFGVTDNEFLNTKIRLSLSDEVLQKRCVNIRAEFPFDAKPFDTKRGENAWLSHVRAGEVQFNLGSTRFTDDYLQYSISYILLDIIFLCLDLKYEESILLPEDKKLFLLPAERAGANLYFRELLSIRNLLLQQAQNDNVNPMLFLKDIVEARYAEPVKDYLQYLNNIRITRNEISNYSNHAQTIKNDILNGEYEVDDFGNVFFIPYSNKKKLPLHFTSSTVKTLFGLVFYLDHLANKEDHLMIDEPELNLHPDNQRKVARVLAQLVNAGLKVIVSTHSSYFVGEINNLIMLNNEFKGVEELRKKYKYQSADNELLDSNRISAYLFDNNEIITMKKDEEGIIVETFDTVTDALNQSSNDIYYAMQDAREIED